VLSHAEELLRLKYATVHDLKALLHVITTEGIDGLHRLQLQPMIPIDPMLAKPGKLTLYGGACCSCYGGACCSCNVTFKIDQHRTIHARVH
jgi:hypothetical protein